MTQTPSIGRSVHYKLSTYDADSINAKRLKDGTPGNHACAGQVYPAVIVRTWGSQTGASVQLQVLLDGPDTYWATSRVEGDAEGQWNWPLRLSDCAVAELPSGEIVGPHVNEDGFVVPAVLLADDNK